MNELKNNVENSVSTETFVEVGSNTVTEITRDGLISGTELLSLDLPPTKWLIKDILPEGLALLAGRPKAGKSWLALNLALSIVKGQMAMNKFDVTKVAILYIPLEDGAKRLQDRISKMDKTLLANSDKISKLFFPEDLSFPTFEDGGFQRIESLLTKYEDIKLVVIDTLGRAMQSSNKTLRKNEYQEAYDLLGKLQTFAISRGITILVVHHTTKKETENPLDSIMGTTGISATLDTGLILKMKSNSTGTLYITGRDTSSAEYSIRMNRETNNFEIIEAEEDENDQLTFERREILRLFENDRSKVLKTSEIALTLRKTRPNISKMLGKMKDDGILVEASYGGYKLPELIE